MTRIGIVGVGFMGMIHYLASLGLKGAQVTALCSRDERKLAGDWRGIRGNFGPAGTVMDLGHLKKYPSLDQMLADPEIDLIDICNPTQHHPATAIKALQAGKDVLVEKAIALSIAEADAMVAASKKSGKLLMVAHVLPFFPEFAYAHEAVKSGRWGKLLGAHFKRVISRPDWSSAIGDAGQTGGPAVDLHIHDTHYISLLCGNPQGVFATGNTENGVVQYLTTQYLYPGLNQSVTCSSGAVCQNGREFVHGFEIYLEKATLSYESGALPLTVYLPDGKAEKAHLEGGGGELVAFTQEIQTAVEGVKSRREPELLSGQLARNALALCFKECESVLKGKVVPF